MEGKQENVTNAPAKSNTVEAFRKEVREASLSREAVINAEAEAPVEEPSEAVTEAVASEEGEKEELPVLSVIAPGVKVNPATGEVTPTTGSKLGMLYVAVLKRLLNPSSNLKVRWAHRRSIPMGARTTWHLLLSEAQGQSIPWKKLGGLLSERRSQFEAVHPVSSYRPPLVNFSRGFQAICRKAMLVTTLRRYSNSRPSADIDKWFPRSFVFYPAKPEKSERKQFLDVFSRRAASNDSGDAKNIWILKPSDGAKGERIRVMAGGGAPSVTPPPTIASASAETAAADAGSASHAESVAAPASEGTKDPAECEPAEASPDDPAGAGEILAFLEGQPKGSIAWVVSEYMERPLLLQPGNRKFDWRIWVLLMPDYTIRLYREGVLRTCSVAFSLEDLSDEFSHLSNHCIQEKAPNFGEFGLPTNEMFYAEWDKLLSLSHPDGAPNSAGNGSVLYNCLLPQAKTIVIETLRSVRETLSCDPEFTHVKAFNVFGFDLMVDADLVVKLIEVNSSPAVAETLLPKLADDLVSIQLETYFDSPTAEAGEAVSNNGWEVIFDPVESDAKECDETATLSVSDKERGVLIEDVFAAPPPSVAAAAATHASAMAQKKAKLLNKKGPAAIASKPIVAAVENGRSEDLH